MNVMEKYINKYDSGIYDVDNIIKNHEDFLKKEFNNLITDSQYLEIIKTSLILENIKIGLLFEEGKKLCYFDMENEIGAFSTGMMFVEKHFTEKDMEKTIPKWSKRYRNIEFFNSVEELTSKKEEISFNLKKVLEQSVILENIARGLFIEELISSKNNVGNKIDFRIKNFQIYNNVDNQDIMSNNNLLFLCFKSAMLSSLKINKTSTSLSEKELTIYYNSKKLFNEEVIDNVLKFMQEGILNEGEKFSEIFLIKVKKAIDGIFLSKEVFEESIETLLLELNKERAKNGVLKGFAYSEYFLQKLIKIIDKEHFDYLKENTSEKINAYLLNVKKDFEPIDINNVIVEENNVGDCITLNINLSKEYQNLSSWQYSIFTSILTRNLINSLNGVMFKDKELKYIIKTDEKHVFMKRMDSFINYQKKYGQNFSVQIKIENTPVNLNIFENYFNRVIEETVDSVNELLWNETKNGFEKLIIKSANELTDVLYKDPKKNGDFYLTNTSILRELTLKQKMDQSNKDKDKKSVSLTRAKF